MKNIFAVAICLFIFNVTNGQELMDQNKENKFNRWSFSSSYGLALFTSLNRTFGAEKRLQAVYELSIDYNLKNNSSFGISFFQSSTSNTYNEFIDYSIGDNEFQFRFIDYQNIITRNIYEAHYKNFYFDKTLSSSIGLYAFNDKGNRFSPNGFLMRGEDYYYFGFSLAVEYHYPIHQNVNIGVKARGLFSLEGNDVMILPTITVHF